MKIVSFIGLAKNVGKTTFLNLYIKNKNNYILTSIGWDGEAIDHLFGISKPSINVRKHNFICTYEKLKPTESKRIVTLPIDNIFLGNLEIYEVLEEKKVQLAGPSSISQLKIFLETLKELTKSIKIEEVIIDGAADRRISLSIANKAYFIIGPTYSRNPQSLINTILAIHKILSIPVLQEQQNKNIIPLKSINETTKFSESDVYLIDTLAQIVLPYHKVTQILKHKYKIYVRKKPEDYEIILNPFDAELMKENLDVDNIYNQVIKIEQSLKDKIKILKNI
jgi:hypothetical protein